MVKDDLDVLNKNSPKMISFKVLFKKIVSNYLHYYHFKTLFKTNFELN